MTVEIGEPYFLAICADDAIISGEIPDPKPLEIEVHFLYLFLEAIAIKSYPIPGVARKDFIGS